ncbi:MAG: hypothetical protein HC797_08465, partial [Anaerolineales bacterium]|nr:hypothetical protein [Anaerolineales bacterium]
MMIYGDAERLQQALDNVLANAIKFTPDNGNITIDGRLLPGFVEITFTDTGIGISTENQGLIFDKFGQLGRTDLHSSGKTKFKGGGPGLGLSISKGIIEAHGGTIWVESEGYDEVKLPGSTFHILLPTRTEPTDPIMTKFFGNLNKPIYKQKRTLVAKKIPQPTIPPRERAFLVGVEIHNQHRHLTLEDSLTELALLADTAGVDVAGELTQKLSHPHVETYIGPGKVQELKALAEETLSDVIIFDNELSPRHQRELEKTLGIN